MQSTPDGHPQRWIAASVVLHMLSAVASFAGVVRLLTIP
jgi:hypothetical protein